MHPHTPVILILKSKPINIERTTPYDHQEDYQATFRQGVYTITLGNGEGKTLTGDLKVNYCESTQDIETKSLIWDWLF